MSKHWIFVFVIITLENYTTALPQYTNNNNGCRNTDGNPPPTSMTPYRQASFAKNDENTGYYAQYESNLNKQNNKQKWTNSDNSETRSNNASQQVGKEIQDDNKDISSYSVKQPNRPTQEENGTQKSQQNSNSDYGPTTGKYFVNGSKNYNGPYSNNQDGNGGANETLNDDRNRNNVN